MKEAWRAIRYPNSTTIPLLFWVLTMISLPVVGWILGEGYLLRGMSFGVLIQVSAVLAILHHAWGMARTLKTFATVAVLSYFAELIGSTTGIPFGKYHYTELLQPQLAGVPLLIPLAWMMMLPPAWAIAEMILSRSSPQSSTPKLPFVILSALAFTAWDLFLDPQMVGWGFWVWEIPGEYFGIPLVNYLGWFLVSALITWIARPENLPVGPLGLVYALTWVLQTIGQAIFWGQPGPALIGFVVCGLFVLLAYLRSK